MQIQISLTIEELKFLYQKILAVYSDLTPSYYSIRKKIIQAKNSYDELQKLSPVKQKKLY